METPNKLVATRAKAEPAKTTQGDLDSALINKVLSWVLSPISAKKIVRKVEKKTERKWETGFWSLGLDSAKGAAIAKSELIVIMKG